MNQRQQNSTSYPIAFLLVSSNDHIAPVTGATPSVSISKNGGSFALASGAVTEIGNGWYSLAGNATDRNTLGEFLIHATATNADNFDGKFIIVPWNPFDGSRLGLTSIPDANPGANGGLPTTNGTKINQTVDLTAGQTMTLTPGQTVTLTPGQTMELTPGQTVSLTPGQTIGINAGGVDAILDEIVEGSLTLRQMLRLISSALYGKASGGGTTTITFRDLGDTKNRVSMTVDSNGNRTAVTLDGA